MTTTIDNGGASGFGLLESSRISCGEDINQDDLLYLCGLSGKGYKSKVTDYAAIGTLAYGTAQTNSATGQIVAQTTIIANAAVSGETTKPVLCNVDGDIFTLATYSGSYGATLTKFSPNGTLIDSVNVDTASEDGRGFRVLELSNGNICVLYALAAASYKIKFAIYDARLKVIKALTDVSVYPSGFPPFFDAIALSGGGFAVIYQDSTSDLLSKLATYDNSGTGALAATTVWTRTGTTGNQYHRIIQLSNGNLAFFVSSSNAVSSIGLYYGVVTIGGAVVMAVTQLDSVSAASTSVIAAGDGYFAVARANSTDQKAWVLTNAGAIQGSGFSAATSAAGSSNNRLKMLWDGSDFYLIWHRSSDSKCVISKLPITGTNYYTAVITTSTTQYNFYLSAFYKDGYIVAISMGGGGNVAPTMWVVDVKKLALVNSAGTTFGSVPGTANGTKPVVVSGNDRAFIAVYDYATTAAMNLCVGKWSQTAMLGVSAESSAKDGVIAVQTNKGTYKINSINGSSSKSFDMSANAILGGKGTVIAGGSITFI